MASYDMAMDSYKNAIATVASVGASLMLARGVMNELVPPQVRDMLLSRIGYLHWQVSSQHTIVIEQKTDGLTSNHVYNAVKTYLASRINTSSQQRLRVSSMDENDKMLLSMAAGQEMADMYDGAEFKWCFISREVAVRSDPGNDGGESHQEVHSFELTFHKKHKEKALRWYLPFIVSTAQAIKDQERSLQIYMNQYADMWFPVDLRHPSTFDTLAMDQKLKQSIMDDLDRFIKRKDYYKRIGKAWKRGYLLYGPPGTGKSSLIAAIANHLRFDIYDLDLTEVQCNSDLRRLLVGMSNRSIIVVEDIDCTIKMKQQEGGEWGSADEEKGEQKVTLSGLLNFVDGLWSASGEGRIIIFTTNYKERLDPALLRPGRMDMHIHMGYCTPEAFRILANNYHSISYHATYPEIEELMKQVAVTPAEVAEILMRNDAADVALLHLVDFLKAKMKEANEIKTENKDANEQL